LHFHGLIEFPQFFVFARVFGLSAFAICSGIFAI